MKTENELKISSLGGGNGQMIMLSGVCYPQCDVWGPGAALGGGRDEGSLGCPTQGRG